MEIGSSPTSRKSALAHLRENVSQLEETQRRFARTVPVSESIDSWLPNRGLSIGCIHEVKGTSLASAIAFASLLASRIPDNRTILYFAPDQSLHPLGLLPYGVKLEQWIHVHARKAQDRAWAVLEALRCPQVGAILAVLEAKDLTLCRRFQLSAESSGVTGFLLGDAASAAAASAVTRWRISSLNGLPGGSFEEAFWLLELLYCRGGRPGKWMTRWRSPQLEPACLSEVPAKPVERATLAEVDVLAG